MGADDSMVDPDGSPSRAPLLHQAREWLTKASAADSEQLVVGSWSPLEDVCVVALRGEMDLNNAAEVRHALGGRLYQSHLVVELSQLTFIDSSGINEFVQIARATKESGATIVLAAATEQVARVFELVKLGNVVALSESLETALASILSRGAPAAVVSETSA